MFVENGLASETPAAYGRSVLRSARLPCTVLLPRYSVASDAQRTGSTPRVAGSLVPRLARNLTQYPAGPICVAILRYSVASDAQRTGSTPRVAGSLVPRLARNLTQYQGQTDPLPASSN